MKRVALLCLLLVTVFAFTVLGSNVCCSVEAFFVSPSVDEVIESRIIELLDDAEDSIYIAVYSFTDDQLGQAVINAYGRGVDVKVLLDDGQDSEAGGREWPRLKEAGVPVKVEHKTGLLHHKFAVIDCDTVITGSYNWSDSADDKNFENAIIISCAVIAQDYINEFCRMSEEIGVSWISECSLDCSEDCKECLRRINEATPATLEACPYIGKILAQRIVEHQPFTVDTCTRTAIKTALEEVPYIGPVRSEALVKCLCGDLDLD